jgi:topoisomerase IA-like protein
VASWFEQATADFGYDAGNGSNAEEIGAMAGKNTDSIDSSVRKALDVLAERFARSKRARKPTLTATMKRRALKEKKAKKAVAKMLPPGPTVGS